MYPLTEIPHRIPPRSKSDSSTRLRLNPEQKSSPLDSYTIWISTEALHIPIVCSYLPWNMAWFSVQLRTNRFSCRLQSTYKKTSFRAGSHKYVQWHNRSFKREKLHVTRTLFEFECLTRYVGVQSWESFVHVNTTSGKLLLGPMRMR